MILYSPSTGGFYDDAVHSPGRIPGDVVTVTSARREELIEAQASEAPVAIIPSETGTPVMSRSRTLSDAEKRTVKLAGLRAERSRRIALIADTQQQLLDLRIGGTEADARNAEIDALVASAASIAAQIDAASGQTLTDFEVSDDALWEPAP